MSGSVGEDFRTLLLAQSGISALVGTRIHIDHVPGEQTEIRAAQTPYIWFSRSGTVRLDCIDAAIGEAPQEETYDFELIGRSLPEARSLYDAVTALHNYRGTMGDRTTQLILFEDHDDDYLPQGHGDTEGLSIIALSVEITL